MEVVRTSVHNGSVWQSLTSSLAGSRGPSQPANHAGTPGARRANTSSYCISATTIGWTTLRIPHPISILLNIRAFQKQPVLQPLLPPELRLGMLLKEVVSSSSVSPDLTITPTKSSRLFVTAACSWFCRYFKKTGWLFFAFQIPSADWH